MIVSLGFSSDGSVLIGGAEDGRVGLWSPYGERVRTPLLAGSTICATAVSEDCRFIAAACGGTVRVFDWLPRRPAPAPLRRKRWDRNGDQVAPAFHGGGTGRAEPRAIDLAVLAVRFTRDGSIVSCGVDQALRVWGPDGDQRVVIPNAHEGGITALAVSPVGVELIASGGRDDVVRLHTMSGDSFFEPFSGHDNDVMTLDFHPDGALVASGSRDKTVCIWEMVGRDVVRYTGHDGEVLAVRFSPDGRHVASAGTDGEVHVWAPGAMSEATVVARTGGRIWGLEFAADGRSLIAVADGGAVVVVDDVASSDRATTSLVGHTGSVRAVRAHPNGRLFLTVATDGALQVWDLEAGRLGPVLEGHVGPVYALDISADGRLAVTGGADNSIRLWRLGDWRAWFGDACGRLAHHPFVAERSDLAASVRRACASPDTPA